MKNIIKGGTPTGFKDLLEWTYESTSYKLDPISNTGYYNINNGFITQSTYDKILKNEQLLIRCSFKSINKNVSAGTMFVNIFFTDESMDYILIPLEYININFNKSKWITTTHEYKTDTDKSIEYINIRIIGKKDISLDVTEIGIDYNGVSNLDNQYDTNEFQDKCILYGFDKDKPALR